MKHLLKRIPEKTMLDILLEQKKRGYLVDEQIAYLNRNKGFTNKRFLNITADSYRLEG